MASAKGTPLTSPNLPHWSCHGPWSVRVSSLGHLVAGPRPCWPFHEVVGHVVEPDVSDWDTREVMDGTVLVQVLLGQDEPDRAIPIRCRLSIPLGQPRAVGMPQPCGLKGTTPRSCGGGGRPTPARAVSRAERR